VVLDEARVTFFGLVGKEGATKDLRRSLNRGFATGEYGTKVIERMPGAAKIASVMIGED